MSQQRVNYDQIAHLYDEPGRDHPLDQHLIDFLNERQDEDIRILDMGCGTGKQLASNRKALSAPLMVGLDRFQGMLRQAQARCDMISWVQGDSARTPFKSESFDYITNQYSYPHVLDKPGLFSEIYRILRRGGRFAMTHIDPWDMQDWAVYRYFPAALERDFQDFMPVDTFYDRLREIGLVNVQIERRYRTLHDTLKTVLAYVSNRFRTSQLMVLSEADYAAGVEAVKADLVKYGEYTPAESKLSIVTIMGDKL